MAVPSAARVNDKYTGDATIIDNTAFYNTMYNIQKDIVTQKKAKELELKKQNQAWDTLLEDMPDVWQADSEYVNKSLNEYNDFIIDLKSKGLDPNDLDVTTMKKMRELENNVAKAASYAKDNETYYNQTFAELNRDREGKYNKQHATEWFKTYADPKLSPQERYKLRNEGNPFKINHSLIDLIDKTIPKPGVTDTGKKKVTSRDATEHKAVVLDYIMNDPVGKEKYESLKKDGEDEIAFAERIAKEGQSRYPIIEDLQTGSTKKTGTGSTAAKDKKPSIKVSTKDADTKYDQNLGINKILYENTKPVYVKDVDGKTVDNFEPSGGFKISPDGNVYAIGTGKNDDGTQVEITVNYGQNKEQFDVVGYTDVFQDFYNKNNQKASGTTGGAKTVKRSDIPKLIEGRNYTAAEYEALLKKNGVTITED
jgi:hypothetical protein